MGEKCEIERVVFDWILSRPFNDLVKIRDFKLHFLNDGCYIELKTRTPKDLLRVWEHNDILEQLSDEFGYASYFHDKHHSKYFQRNNKH